MDPITANVISATIRLFIALFIFWVYIRNKYKFALYFAVFFLLFSAQSWFGMINLLTGEVGWFFLHRLFMAGGTVAILIALSHTNVKWITKSHLPKIVGILALTAAIIEASIWENSAGSPPFWAAIPTLSIGALGLFIAGYYSRSLIKDSWITLCLLSGGFLMLGLVHIAAIWLIPWGYSSVIYYSGLVSTLMVGFGWWIGSIEDNKK